MVVSQYLCHLIDGIVAQFFGKGTHYDAAEESLGGKTLHDGGVGSNQQIVLIHAPVVIAFRLQDTNNAERNAFEAYNLTDAICILTAE